MTENRRPAPIRWRPRPLATAGAAGATMAAVGTLLAVNVARGEDPALRRVVAADRPAASSPSAPARRVVVIRRIVLRGDGQGEVTALRPTSADAPAPSPIKTSQS